MSNYEIAAKLVKEHFSSANHGLFDCRNIIGDPMVVLYDDGKFSVEICYSYSYFEVFGLSEEEFQKLSDLYQDLREGASEE